MHVTNNNPEFRKSLNILNGTHIKMFQLTQEWVDKRFASAHKRLGAVSTLHSLAYRNAVEAVVTDDRIGQPMSKVAVIQAVHELMCNNRVSAFNHIFQVEGFGTDHIKEPADDVAMYLSNFQKAGHRSGMIAEKVAEPYEANLRADVTKAIVLITSEELFD
jgi:hypothetical protein